MMVIRYLIENTNIDRIEFVASKIYWGLEAIIISIGIYLSGLAKQRVGLHRHLYFRLFQAESSFLNPDYKWIWVIISIACFVVALYALYMTRKKIQFCYRFSWRIHWIIIASFSLVILMFILLFNGSTNWIIYPYFILGFVIMSIGNFIGNALIYFFHPETKPCAI